MKRLQLTALVVVAGVIPARSDATDYAGIVGRLEAHFSLTFANGNVSGSYAYPSRPGVRYRLTGTNPSEGLILLEEYTGDDRSARCMLTKIRTEESILWRGIMRNTDGRQFPMRFSRRVEAGSSGISEADLRRQREIRAVRSSLEKDTRWAEFRRANEIVESVPHAGPGWRWLKGLVTGFESGEQGLTLSYLVEDGTSTDEENPRFGGELFTLHMARSLGIEPSRVIGQEIGVFVSPEGRLMEFHLTAIAVTHWRTSRDGGLEIRGPLQSPSWWDGRQFLSSGEARDSTAGDVLQLRPDKLAIREQPVESILFRDLYLSRDFGIVVRATAAGPGMLELETISLLPPAAPNEPPWNFVGDRGGRSAMPPSQRIREAG